MSYVECCNGRRKCDVYKLENIPGTVLNYAYYLEACPVCGHTVLLLRRYLPDGRCSCVRKVNKDARKLFDKIRVSILFKIRQMQPLQASGFYLRYGEFGVVKKCYSNLSTLKIGLFDYPGDWVTKIPEKIQKV